MHPDRAVPDFAIPLHPGYAFDKGGETPPHGGQFGTPCCGLAGKALLA
jgi:hypothetical protein